MTGPRGGGVIGILGPTRLRYERAVGAIRYMAGVLDRLLVSRNPSL